MTASRASWVAVSAAEAIGCHSCSACRRLRAEANANNSTMMATTRTIAPMIQPQGVELPDAGWLGAVVVVVGASVVVVVGASVVVVVGPSVVVVVGASVVVVVGASVVVVTSPDVVGGSVVDVDASVVVGASAEGLCDPTPVVVLDEGLLARFDPWSVPQAAMTPAAPRIRRPRSAQPPARRSEACDGPGLCLIAVTTVFYNCLALRVKCPQPKS